MGRQDAGIGEAFAHLAETVGRLVGQHLALARVEVEGEARGLAMRARRQAGLVGRGLPFVVAGLVLASLGLAQAAALTVEPWLGRLAPATSQTLTGLAEAALAWRWLGRRLTAVDAALAAPRTGAPGNGTGTALERGPDGAGSGARGHLATDREEI